MKNKANQVETLTNTSGLIPQLEQRSMIGPSPFLSRRKPKMMIIEAPPHPRWKAQIRAADVTDVKPLGDNKHAYRNEGARALPLRHRQALPARGGASFAATRQGRRDPYR